MIIRKNGVATRKWLEDGYTGTPPSQAGNFC